jgi:hypothetical protein
MPVCADKGLVKLLVGNLKHGFVVLKHSCLYANCEHDVMA